jgi:hypothetical protein
METPVPMGTAVKPKPLSDTVKKGLEYLIHQQHPNGGWGQGGGWRTADKGGRIEGAEVKDPPDVGNTCIAVLALIRAGSTPKDGPYAKNVAQAVEFICGHIEKADDKSLDITEIKGTQIQSKIGPYVDTFLASMVLAEVKGKMPDARAEKRMQAALTKTIAKMEKNQQKDGAFAGNMGWAPVLSQGLANKGFARASQSGIKLAEETLNRVQGQVAANFDPKTMGTGVGAGAIAASPVAAGRVATRTAAVGGPGPGSGAGAIGRPGDAGVPIYTASTYLTNAADVSNSLRAAEGKAKETLARKDATAQEKEKAKATLKNLDDAEQVRNTANLAVIKALDQPAFVQGFGSNGGEEFLSFMNIGEALLLKGGDDWKKWDKTMTESLTRIQDKDGSWSGHHCITGKTFCTSTALLVLLTDRAPIPVASAPAKK